MSVNWHQNILESLVVDEDGQIKCDEGLGLVDITYLSKSHQYRVKKNSDIEKSVFEAYLNEFSTTKTGFSATVIVDGGLLKADPVVVKTLSSLAAIFECGKAIVWHDAYDVDEYKIEGIYEDEHFSLGDIIQVDILKENLIFNAVVESVSLSVADKVTQSITVSRHLI